MLTINNSNLEPNIKWFIWMSSDTSNIYVYCYQSLADAQNLTNNIANKTVPIGSNVQVALNQAYPSPITVAAFDPEIPWHLIVSGGQNEPATIFQVGPWSDMDPVKHTIYANRDIIPYRAAALIDKATKLDTQIRITYAGTIYNLEPNDTVRVNSSFMAKDFMTTVREVSIELSDNAMLMTVGLSKFDQITR